CHFVMAPAYKDAKPSEACSMAIWIALFSIMSTKLTFLTGEKVLEASKTIKRRLATEFAQVTDFGKKVDCAIMWKGIELSNIEFKEPEVTARL
ncbi:hypothetical protein BGZ94_007666, partial [Podila epigama]